MNNKCAGCGEDIKGEYKSYPSPCPIWNEERKCFIGWEKDDTWCLECWDEDEFQREQEENKKDDEDEVGTIPCYDCGVECEDEKINTIERLGRGVCLECFKDYDEGNKKLNSFYLKELEENRSKMATQAFKNTMEELVGLRERLLKEAYELSYDKTPFPEGMICRDENGEQIFGSSVFNEEVFDVVKESSIYHIIYEYDGEIEYLGFKKNPETLWKYGLIGREEYDWMRG
jgi:hypothetical protein